MPTVRSPINIAHDDNNDELLSSITVIISSASRDESVMMGEA
jgi:hypothetical protein